jgi:4-aminobutyrate aminotransferase
MNQSSLMHLSPVVYRYTDILVDRAEGLDVYATDGQRYLDFTSGIAVTNTGHCHPRVVAAAQEQVAKIIHGQHNILYHQPLLDLLSELPSLFPSHISRFFFANSGAEAVESAMKLARQATGKPNMIVFEGGFHGRTVGTMSLTTSNTIYRAGYGPLMPGVFVAPFPYAYHYGWSAEETLDFCIEQLQRLLLTQTAPEETAAMLVEPVLGEGGYVFPPSGFLTSLRAVCDEHDILLIVDEIQTGFGRTGRWFAHQHEDVEPDIVTMAKALGSGFPLSAIGCRPELLNHTTPGSHGGTYAANAVSCAAAAATIRTIREEALVENSAALGEYLLGKLEKLQEEYPVVGDVRGLGLMVGTEFTTPDGHPDGDTAKAVRKACLDRNLILLSCGPHGNVIRWIPALVVSREEIDEALQVFEEALTTVCSQS